MIDRQRFSVMALALTLLVALVLPTQAAAWHNLDCYCDPATNASSLYDPESKRNLTGCKCEERYTLGRSSTQEFRFRCKSDNAYDQPFPDISARDSGTTCTTEAYSPSYGVDYLSKSCTNWDPTSSDTLTLTVICELKK